MALCESRQNLKFLVWISHSGDLGARPSATTKSNVEHRIGCVFLSWVPAGTTDNSLALAEPNVVLAPEAVWGEDNGESLSEALDRFWKQNIEPQFPDLTRSILSEPMVHLLVEHRPETEDQWFNTIPIALRQTMDSRQREFLEDILDLVAEYA